MRRIQLCWLVPLVLMTVLLASACDCQKPDEPAVATSAESHLFPEIEPYDTGMLKVSDLHEIYYEQVGNPEGIPVMILHGGPGVGTYARLRRYFDPSRFRMVLHSQRGCGDSTPFAEIRGNTTPDLVEDIEKLRKHLKLGKVVIFGGSWGTTLGLSYAEAYPENVTRMVLRGVFLGTEEGILYHYFGSQQYFPAAYAALVDQLPDKERGPDPEVLFELINGADTALADRVVDALYFYESKMGQLEISDQEIRGFLSSWPAEAKRSLALIDLHYVRNMYFLEEGQLLANAHKLEGIDLAIINGRYDIVCPPKDAYALHRAVPGSTLVIVEQAGHSESEPGITAALVKAANSF